MKFEHNTGWSYLCIYIYICFVYSSFLLQLNKNDILTISLVDTYWKIDLLSPYKNPSLLKLSQLSWYLVIIRDWENCLNSYLCPQPFIIW